MILALASSSFKRKGFKNNPQSSWWCPISRAQRSKVKALFRRLRRDPADLDIKERYNRENAIYKKEIRRSKRNFWKHLCDNAKDKFDLAFKLAHNKVLLPEHLIHTVLTSGADNESSSDVFKTLVVEKLGDSEQQQVREEQVSMSSNIRFTRSEMQFAFESLKQNKAPCLDLLDVRMVRAIQRENFGLLTRVFNTCVRLGKFPEI